MIICKIKTARHDRLNCIRCHIQIQPKEEYEEIKSIGYIDAIVCLCKNCTLKESK